MVGLYIYIYMFEYLDQLTHTSINLTDHLHESTTFGC